MLFVMGTFETGLLLFYNEKWVSLVVGLLQRMTAGIQCFVAEQQRCERLRCRSKGMYVFDSGEVVVVSYPVVCLYIVEFNLI